MKIENEIIQSAFRNETHKLGVNIVFTFSWVQSYFSSILKPFGLSTQQFNVLRILRGQHPRPASVKLIRDRMLDKMSDASRIVEKLRMKGLVDRRVRDDDRRTCEVAITDKGMKLLAQIDKEQEAFDSVFSELTKKEVIQLNALLDKLRGN